MADEEGRDDEDAYLYGEPVGDDIKGQMTMAGAGSVPEEMETSGSSEQPEAAVTVTRKRKLETDEEGGEEDGEAEEGVKEGQEGETTTTGEVEGKEGEDDGDGDAGNDDVSDDDDDDSDDDGVQVVIGDIKGGQSASAFGSTPQPIKRVGPPPDKKGKFSAEDFDMTGTINGVPAQDFSLDSLEDKPWRKPGADITDYFNYGFTEDTWRAYCDRQKRLRYESGAGTYVGLAKGPQQGMDSKAGIEFPKKIQTGVRRDGMGMGMGMNQGYRREEPRENTIQVRVVMTADRREYGRQKFDNMGPPMGPPPGFNMNLPPPGFPPPDFMGPEFFNHPPPGYYQEEEEPYDDQQQWMDSQWEMGMEGQGMGPSPSINVVPLTKVAVVPPPPGESADSDSTADLPPVQKTEKTDDSK